MQKWLTKSPNESGIWTRTHPDPSSFDFAAPVQVPCRITTGVCGTNAVRAVAGSYTGLALMRSICRQIHHVFGHAPADSERILLEDYPEVIRHFHGLLAGTINKLASQERQ